MVTMDLQYVDYIREIYDTFSPLCWLLKIFSLECHRCTDKKIAPSYWNLIKTVLIIAIFTAYNLLGLYFKVTYFYKILTVSITYTDMFQVIFDLVQYIVDLYFVFNYGSGTFYEYIRQYAYIDGLIGMEYYESIKRRLINALIFVISLWLLNSLCDFAIWAVGFGFIGTTAFAGSYVYMLIKILTNLHLTVHVMHIESRLRGIGDLIQEFYCASVSCKTRIEDAVIKENWFYTKRKSKTHKSKLCPVKSFSCKNCDEVKSLTRCYLLLTEQVNFINRMFGIRILLNSLSLLVDMVRFTNITVRVVLGTQGTGFAEAFYPAAISSFWRSLTCAAVVVSLVSHCEDTYRQRERVISLVEHLIINRSLDEKMLAAFEEFRRLVRSQPISFHMANFMRLDYPLLASIASVYVTYTIILLQSI